MNFLCYKGDSVDPAEFSSECTRIRIDGAKGFNDSVALDVARALMRCNNLQQFSIKNCYKVTADGLLHILNTLPDSLRTLKIDDIDLSFDCLQALGTLISSCPRLYRLRLRNCNIADFTLHHILDNVPPSLTHLCLDSNRMIGDAGAHMLMVTERLPNIDCLRVSGCNITEAGAPKLAMLVEVHPTLQITAWYNPINAQGRQICHNMAAMHPKSKIDVQHSRA